MIIGGEGADRVLNGEDVAIISTTDWASPRPLSTPGRKNMTQGP